MTLAKDGVDPGVRDYHGQTRAKIKREHETMCALVRYCSIRITRVLGWEIDNANQMAEELSESRGAKSK